MTGLELYTDVSYDSARRLTNRYSSSFSLASRLFSPRIRPHIYAIYGMVRAADEIVDTYAGSDRAELLESFYHDVSACLVGTYSANPIVHAFGVTARKFGISHDLIDPFFASMRMDLDKTEFSGTEYDEYIYGSAEVIGLMCLKVFCAGDPDAYAALVPGARKLGSAYQKVNFLRDFAADYTERGRIYFPDVTYESWNDETKDSVLEEIAREFTDARVAITELPCGARTSVYLSYAYYRALLTKLSRMGAQQILTTRAHVSTLHKFGLLLYAPIGSRLR